MEAHVSHAAWYKRFKYESWSRFTVDTSPSFYRTKSLRHFWQWTLKSICSPQGLSRSITFTQKPREEGCRIKPSWKGKMVEKRKEWMKRGKKEKEKRLRGKGHQSLLDVGVMTVLGRMVMVMAVVFAFSKTGAWTGIGGVNIENWNASLRAADSLMTIVTISGFCWL